MTLLVDPRMGSAALLCPLCDRGLPAESATLEFGDVAFAGNGPEGTVLIGIEYKHMGEAISCMTSGRFAGHQLLGMADYYEYWLLIDDTDRYRTGREGQLQLRAGQGWYDVTQGERAITALAWEHWLLSMQTVGGCRVHRCEGRYCAAEWIGYLYTWWQKEWADHRSVGAFNRSRAIRKGEKPTLSRLWANDLPGVGHERSEAIATAFPCALDLANASIDELMKVEGIGKTGARKIRAAIETEGYRP
jgi:ERCC4-type nuclease